MAAGTTVLLPTRDSASDLVDPFAEEMATFAAARGSKVLWGEPLHAKIGWSPVAALHTCGADITCLAELGRTAGAERVVVARINPPKSSPGYRIELRVIDVASRSMSATLRDTLRARGDIAPWLEEHARTWLADDAALDVPDLVALPVQVDPHPPEADAPWLNPWFYTGATVTGVGVVLAAVAAGFATSGQIKADSITPDLDLPAAVAQEAEARQDFDLANGLFVAAGATAAAGVALLVIAFTAGEDEPTPVQVSGGLSGAGVHLVARW